MKMKKLVAGLLSAAMVFTSVSYNGYGVNQAEAAGAAVAKTEKVETLVKYAGTELASKAKANSETSASGSDGPASWAFDNSNHWWHSNYSSGAVQVPRYDITTDAKSGEGNNKGDIWIQTGFNSAQTVYGLEYTSRGGTENNQIREYEVWVSSAETEPAVATAVTGNNDGWTKAATGTFYQVARERAQVARFAEPATNVKWIRLVAKNVYGANGYVAAKKIEFFTGVTESQANLNSYQSFWDAETNAGTLSVQTDKDRWQFEVKTGGKWKNYLTSGNKRTDGVFFEGGWRTDSNDSISRDGFRQRIGGAFEANALTWVAPEEGYYQFKQVGTASTSDVAGKMNLYFVTSNDGTSNGTDLDGEQNHNSGAEFESPVKEMQKGDKFRFASEKSTNNQNVNNYCDGTPKVNWEVIDCTKEVAARLVTEARAKLEAGNNKPQAVKDAYKAAIDALDNAVTANESTASLMTKITALEVATTTFESYVSVETLSISKTELKLNVGCEETLTCTFNPTEPTDKAVTWSSDDQSVATAVDGKVTAVGIGTTNVKVTWNADQTKTATCVVTVVADKTALTNKIKEAEELLNGKYTAASLAELSKVIDAAKVVVNDDKATVDTVVAEVAKLETAIAALEVGYTVTVDGQAIAEYTKVAYNTKATITAPEKTGVKFAGWKLNGVIVSQEVSYTFYVAGDMDFTAVYGEDVCSASALLLDTKLEKLSTGKTKATFVGQLVVPEGYKMLQAGVVWKKNPTETTLHTEGGNVVSGARVKVMRAVNKQHQFSYSLSGLTPEISIGAEVFGKLQNTATGEIVWVYAPMKTVTGLN